jgi:sec-independent protein translocase protein TatC
MAALAAPLILLYFGAGGIALLVDKRRARKANALSDDESSSIEDVAEIGEPEPER